MDPMHSRDGLEEPEPPLHHIDISTRSALFLAFEGPSGGIAHDTWLIKAYISHQGHHCSPIHIHQLRLSYLCIGRQFGQPTPMAFELSCCSTHLNSIPAFLHLIGPSLSFPREAVLFWHCFTISVLEMGAEFWWRCSRFRSDLLHTEQRIALLVK
jgi:hypothetical protein